MSGPRLSSLLKRVREYDEDPRPSKQTRRDQGYGEDTIEPHKGGQPHSTRDTYPRAGDYAMFKREMPTDPLELDMRGHLGFRHVRCPRGVSKCQCGLHAYHLDSLVIAIDGACPGNGSHKATRSGGGIYFGDGMGTDSTRSDYQQNFAFSVPDHADLPHTSQRAELYAAAGALLKARHYVEKGGQYPCGDKCATPCTVKHIVLKTDSAYLVNGITNHINKWETNGWQTAAGTDVKNRDLWVWVSTFGWYPESTTRRRTGWLPRVWCRI
ncbi:Ribonuclease H1 [Apiospora hydei]|uniref:ribonuclease H n=1 Tax=Apiospora hydei TaxID=1337664 RepID=A0ABR1WYP0_9PEZI